jgi:hypothetical protein
MNGMIRNMILCGVALLLPHAALAQCARCGDGGGTERPPGYVIQTGFRTLSPTPFPNGSGSLSAAVTTRSELLFDAAVPIGSAQVSLTFTGAGAENVTGLELRKTPSGDSNGDLVADLTPNLDSLTLRGAGTAIRQGSLPPEAFPLDARTNAYFVRIQVNSGAWIKLNLAATQAEFVAIARLTPFPGPGVSTTNEGTGVFSATVARDASGAIGSAEIRFEAYYKYEAGGLGGAALLQSIGIASASRLAANAPGPFFLSAGVTGSVPLANRGVVSFRRQITAAADSQDVLNLETLLRNPGAYYFDLDTDRPAQDLGGPLSQASPQRVRLEGSAIDSGVADAIVDVYVARTPAGAIAGGYASFDWVYREFHDGPVFTAIQPYDTGGKEIKEFDSSAKDGATVNHLLLDPASNDLKARESTGGFGLRLPLLPTSPVFVALTASPEPALAGFVLTQAKPSGAATFTSSVLQGVDVGPFISRIEPAITTPGSLVTVFGNGFSLDSRMFIGGFETAGIRVLDANRLIARVAPDMDTRTAERLAFVMDPLGRTSNNIGLVVDIVEPYIFPDVEGGPSVVNALTQVPVRAASPVRSGDQVLIIATGFTASPTSPLRMYPGISANVAVGGKDVPATVVQDANELGAWRVLFTIPTDLPDAADGRYKLLIKAVWKSPLTGAETPFPSNAVDFWVAR